MIDYWIRAIALRATTVVGPLFPFEVIFAALLTALLCWLIHQYPVASIWVIRRFHLSIRHASFYILASMLFPVVFRLALLPWFPPPHPHVHDEFVHLLVADTLAAGRLANPPHPLARHLETIYVLQQPTYAAIYPLGQGAILAFGKVLTGSAWAGVLLASALMGGAITWMLFGAVPPAWAAIGGLIASFHLGAKWMDSYWGGALWAFGGALLFGALSRLRAAPSTVMGLTAGFGWAIIWLSRPFESLPCCIFASGVIVLLVTRDSASWRKWILPIASMLLFPACAGLVTAFHNRAVTGSFTTLPYQLSQRAYGVPQSLLWQPPIEAPHFRFPESRDMYQWQRTIKDAQQQHAGTHAIRRAIGNLVTAWGFYIPVWYLLPMLVVLLLLGDIDVFLAIALVLCTIAASVLYPFFFAHYIAAYACLIMFLIIRGMMLLCDWSFRGRALGRILAMFLTAGGFVTAIIPEGLASSSNVHGNVTREQISEKLMRSGSRHVVFIRYGPNHRFQDEWVYNSADVDASPIVWCRAMGFPDDIEVTRYYKNRQAWIANVNGELIRVSTYQPELLQAPPR